MWKKDLAKLLLKYDIIKEEHTGNVTVHIHQGKVIVLDVLQKVK